MNMNRASYYSKLDIQSKCRACLTENGKVLIFSLYGKSKINVKDIFEVYTGVKIDEEDDLPKSLCLNCFNALISTNTFISKCRSTNMVLHTLENVWSSKNSNDCIVIVTAQQNTAETSPKNNLGKYMESSEKKVYGANINDKNVSFDMLTDTEKATEIKNDVDKDIANSNQEEILIIKEDVVNELSGFDVIGLINSTDAVKKEIEVYNIQDKLEIVVDVNEQIQCSKNNRINCSDEDVARLDDIIHLPPQPIIENNVKNKIDKDEICHVCSKTCIHSRALKEHINAHFCSVCQRKFSLRSNLTRHMVVHTGEKPYTCDVCGKAYSQTNALKQHKERHFSDSSGQPEKKLCSYCGIILDSNNKYLRHLMNTHGDIELSEEDKKIFPYFCKTCNRRFQYKGTFDMHMDVHKGIKNYLCNYCGQSFYKKGDLRVHMIIHTGERPYKCDFCDKAFAQRTTYISHKRIHTGVRPFQCKTCSASFKQSSQLGYHMLTHTGQKHYSCTSCGKKFARKGNLKQHMIVHTNETPHICSYCDKGFISANKMRKHQMVHLKNTQ